MKVRILKAIGDFYDEHNNRTSNPVIHSYGLVGHVVEVSPEEGAELLRKGWAAEVAPVRYSPPGVETR